MRNRYCNYHGEKIQPIEIESGLGFILSYFLLKNKLEHYKSLLKQERHILKTTNNELKDVEYDLITQPAELLREEKKKYKGWFTCSKCGDYRFPSNRKKRIHMETCNNEPFEDYKITNRRNAIQRELDLTNSNIKVLHENIRKLEKVSKELTEKVRDTGKFCISCNRHAHQTRNTDCPYEHIICFECYDKIEDHDSCCPICKESIEINRCDICFSGVHRLIDTKCGNGHHACTFCLGQIYSHSRQCPFCRCRMKTDK
jgi:hypothetical protein